MYHLNQRLKTCRARSSPNDSLEMANSVRVCVAARRGVNALTLPPDMWHAPCKVVMTQT